ncbi:SirB2 family protein [Lacimicrobium sp. SS2-24]|uniref:SirB2 family protein n=1 Tax=Lacimicrobium sp. SS2-24 TaxID=2005569 RepID=UPI000B4A7591|nr:SirB2 family protein [Lacimicrobium sp. SS2-24]
MEYYLPIKHMHMLFAYLSALLFVARVLMDQVGYQAWRKSVLSYIPHINDSLLLTFAFLLVALGPWNPFAHAWLGIKLLLLIGYIVAGLIALRISGQVPVKRIAALLALAQLVGIFYLATAKPDIF